MATLDRLFGESRETDTDLTRDASEVARLRSIVGPGVASAAPLGGRSADERRLTELVGGSEPAASPASPASAASAVSLADLIGGPGVAIPRTATGNMKIIPPGNGGKVKGAARRSAADWVSGGLAVVAIAAVVAVGAIVIVQSTSSNETTQATQSLRAQETDLRNRTTTLETSIDLYGSALTEAEDLGVAAEATLVALEGRSDEAARGAALAAVAALRTALDAQESPEAPAPYARATPAPTDLATVASQLDTVRAAADEVEVVIDETRAARTAVADAQGGLLAALAVFGQSLAGSASVIAGENAAAGEAFRGAVAATAASVVAAQQQGQPGFVEMTAYAGAVDALRAENARVLAERAAEAEREAERNSGYVWRPTTPVTPPVEETPVEPEPQPTEEPPVEEPDPGTPPGDGTGVTP